MFSVAQENYIFFCYMTQHDKQTENLTADSQTSEFSRTIAVTENRKLKSSCNSKTPEKKNILKDG